MISKEVSLETKANSDIDTLLEGLSNGNLADRIAQAARIAAARHMLLQSQEMQSAVEAEHST